MASSHKEVSKLHCRDRRPRKEQSDGIAKPQCGKRPVRKGINLIRRKQRDNPDRFLKSVGVRSILFANLEFV